MVGLRGSCEDSWVFSLIGLSEFRTTDKKSKRKHISKKRRRITPAFCTPTGPIANRMITTKITLCGTWTISRERKSTPSKVTEQRKMVLTEISVNHIKEWPNPLLQPDLNSHHGLPLTHATLDNTPAQPQNYHSLNALTASPSPTLSLTWSTYHRGHQRSSADRPASIGQALVNIAEAHRQRRLTRNASASSADAIRGADGPRRSPTRSTNGILPTSMALEVLASAAGDLEAKLCQQLSEFERSLMAPFSSSAVDLNQQSAVSRHFSIMDYRDESDIFQGSSASKMSNTSVYERPRTLRPPPPRPQTLRTPVPAACRPMRPAPRPPPPRQNPTRPASNPVHYSPDEPQVLAEDQESGDLGDAKEHEIQMELESAEDEVTQRLQEVERDMEEYSRTAEELRAMLEEEEDEETRMQALENLEFCNCTLEALAREQQQLQLQGKTKT
ncbi:Dynamin-binding protein [Oryzias melastigma]|uniref:Dynamin-binding protein n=1 Tax=Oryzias melastigma TaxID=30732 RepID=A0A834C3W8_ORYME|nr:Dynamin-binding protein [Oryzias melastigma]